jgi:hypothetical protein
MGPPFMTRTIRAFIVASLVATAVNALILVFQLQTPAPASPPVIAWRVFLISVLGLPFALAATVALGVPAYILARRTSAPTLVVAVAAGALIAAIVTAAFAWATGSWSSVSLARTIPIGVIAASVWWWVAIRRGGGWPEFS